MGINETAAIQARFDLDLKPCNFRAKTRDKRLLTFALEGRAKSSHRYKNPS
jgi:hypothetical protein